MIEAINDQSVKSGRSLSTNDDAGSAVVESNKEGKEGSDGNPKRHNFTAENFIGVLSALEFAVIILIAQRRLPLAARAEFVVVLSMLMITAAHSRIVAFLPDGSSITSEREALQFVAIAVPIFLYMMIIELWFISYLFDYDANVELKDFEDNAETMLIVAKTLSILKVLLVLSLLVVPPLVKRYVAKMT